MMDLISKRAVINCYFDDCMKVVAKYNKKENKYTVSVKGITYDGNNIECTSKSLKDAYTLVINWLYNQL